jgi:hypothetical protein
MNADFLVLAGRIRQESAELANAIDRAGFYFSAL